MKCNKDCEVFSRIVGYYRPVSNWNKGKQEEFKMRKTFKPETPEQLKVKVKACD